MAVNPNTVSLDAEEFFCDPQKVLRLVFDFFGQSCSDEQLCGILNGDLFGQYSKTPGRRFNNSARIMRRAEFFRENGPIVEETRRWILEQIPEQSLPVKMLRPLTGVSGPLLETCRDYSAS
ncbi:MAG TPA: hypothetical protein ENK16_08000 [Chromatiales bacterium]|nr:hypothetical protein [Chromatiales bacterium]